MSERTVDHRLSEVEREQALQGQALKDLKEDVIGVGRSLTDFRRVWENTKESERQAVSSTKLGVRDYVTMASSVAAVVGLMVGGITYMITSQASAVDARAVAATNAVRSDATAQIAQVGLTVRGQVESITALSQAMQVMQRDMAQDRVKLGLVEQTATAHDRFIREAQGYDALVARLEEQRKAAERRLEVIERLMEQRRAVSP